ncbi:MAG: hypothetical protein QOE41_1558 [Mycobacterium sp.]|jgi:hypothetical protein|nr:Cell surface protein [Mycobacterium sp.]MDT5132247.1 hypothetical protein [Mycobacterium sp.]
MWSRPSLQCALVAATGREPRLSPPTAVAGAQRRRCAPCALGKNPLPGPVGSRPIKDYQLMAHSTAFNPGRREARSGGGDRPARAGPCARPCKLGAWPAALHHARHSGASASSGPTAGVPRWQRHVEGGLTPGPVVGPDGTIYAASNGGVLHASTPPPEQTCEPMTPGIPMSAATSRYRGCCCPTVRCCGRLRDRNC